jgi:7,8-dihydroneopterin aldolase/epimerase/oxygenase
MSGDRIHIKGIKAYGYTGALPEETVLGQWFEVDLTLWLDLSLAGRSDRLADTHNYATMVAQTQQLIETEKFQLLERLADAIATQALGNDPRITQVQVKLTKPTPPIPNFSGQIVVDITRQQNL